MNYKRRKFADLFRIVIWTLLIAWSVFDIAHDKDVVMNVIGVVAAIAFIVLDVRNFIKHNRLDKLESV